MTSIKKILLASHGTKGAMAAEQIAVTVAHQGAKLHHLIVIPTFWHGMIGDDWLNNGSTRNKFRRYLEGQLEQEITHHCSRVSTEAKEHALHYSNEIIVGNPGKCLLESSRKDQYDLVIIGSPRPKSERGLRSRMAIQTLTRSLNTPLLIVPYPYE